MKAEPSVNLEQSVITNKSAGDWKLFIAKLKKKKKKTSKNLNILGRQMKKCQ